MSGYKLHPDRLFSSDNKIRDIARNIYSSIRDLPIISPHGHTDPNWFADNQRFANPADFLIKPDRYIFRILYSQGISLQSLGISPAWDAMLSKTQEKPVVYEL
ncbi:glucuronate isomerase [Parendozoicomonas sp. Alg238-R29]|uniref:glucuronate isomerase n=1 Tax=Parendozoicomonas sp. Alg238-R29 TaxID=2993446 RepID=UPI00248DA8FD|nr:glucuronate isomerase [Parendozoicomonas sp. Alg238-R29]